VTYIRNYPRRWSSRPTGASGPRPLLPAAQGEHHLPGHADRRHIANLVCAQLLHLESENPDKDINIYINSPGGDITRCSPSTTRCQYIKPDISTICFGQAASAAAVLLAAGTKGKRLALPHSRVLLHQPWGGGRARPPTSSWRPRRSCAQDLLEEILAEHTGQTIEKIHRTDTDRDFVMTAEEAKEYGIIDEVIGRRSLADNTVRSGERVA
jgi:ATP-dependent Clp protease, protease subunit